uniref:Uncharacterized protein n=1 Tax=Anopheles darlingi TaxID=43151 RepID=A0A2M4DJ67_ANODA
MMVRGGGRAAIVLFLLTRGIRTNKHQPIFLVVAHLTTDSGGSGSGSNRLRSSHFRFRRRVAAKCGRIVDETIRCRPSAFSSCNSCGFAVAICMVRRCSGFVFFSALQYDLFKDDGCCLHRILYFRLTERAGFVVRCFIRDIEMFIAAIVIRLMTSAFGEDAVFEWFLFVYIFLLAPVFLFFFFRVCYVGVLGVGVLSALRLWYLLECRYLPLTERLKTESRSCAGGHCCTRRGGTSPRSQHCR